MAPFTGTRFAISQTGPKRACELSCLTSCEKNRRGQAAFQHERQRRFLWRRRALAKPLPLYSYRAGPETSEFG